jgi:putative intracellular protease/amidase
VAVTEPGVEVAPRHGGSWLARGGVLRFQSLTSASGRCTLVHEPDGRVVLYDNALAWPMWATPTPGAAYLALGLDGCLVVCGRYRRPVWAGGTAGSGAERLEVRDSGEVVLQDGGGAVVWTSGTRVRPAEPCCEPARGSVMRCGQRLRRQSLTSDDGSTVLLHGRTSVQVRDPGGRLVWSVAYRPAETYLVLDDDGILRVRDTSGSVVREIAGPGTELVVVSGCAQLRDGSGAVVWTTARGGVPDAVPPQPPTCPGQHQLASWVDSLAGQRGYCATVVLDLAPADALRRLGLHGSEIACASWPQLQARRRERAAAAATVAAVPLGPHTLLLADDRQAGPPGPALSGGTTAVTSCHSPGPGVGRSSAFLVQRDGVIAVEIGITPPRRKGVRLPEVRQALSGMRSVRALITADSSDLELMCRVAGVSPTAADLTGELLGGILTASAGQLT